MSLLNHVFKYFVAIDQSKDFFDVSIKDLSKNLLFTGQYQVSFEGFLMFKNKLLAFTHTSIQDDFLLGVESTGIYHKTLFNYFLKNGFLILELNPVQVKNFAKGNSFRKTSNDRISAFHIADFLIEHHKDFAHYQNLTDDYLQLRELTRLVINIDQQISIFKNKSKAAIQQLFPELPANTNVFSKTMLKLLMAFPSPQSILSLLKDDFIHQFNRLLSSRGRKPIISGASIYNLAQKSIGYINPQLGTTLMTNLKLLDAFLEQKNVILKSIKLFIKSHKDIQAKVLTLATIPGIGIPTAAMFIAEVGDIERFRNKNSLVAFAGLDPATQKSGVSVNKTGHISRMGSSYLRKIMYMAALNASNHDIQFYRWKQSKKEAVKSGKKATVCLANKLVKIIYSMLKNNTTFNPDLVFKNLNQQAA